VNMQSTSLQRMRNREKRDQARDTEDGGAYGLERDVKKHTNAKKRVQNEEKDLF